MKRYIFLSLFALLFLAPPGHAFASYPLYPSSTAFSVTLNTPVVSGLSLSPALISGTYDVSAVPAGDTYICMIPYLDATSWNAGGNSHLVAGMGLDATNQNFYFNPGWVCFPRPASNTGTFGMNVTISSLGAHTVGVLALGLVRSSNYCGAGANAPCYKIPDGDGQDFAPISFTVVTSIPNNAPTATIVTPTTNPYSTVSGTSIMFYGTATDPDTGDYTAAVEWRDGSCTAGTLLNNTDFLFYKSDLSLGSHDIYFRTKDSHGAWSSCATVTVNITPPPAPTVTLNAYATTVYVGNSATLYWSPNYATSCTASGDWSGSKASSYTTEVLPAYTATGTHTYNLSCTGPGGTTAATPLTITVTTPPAPTVNLYLSPTTTLTYATALSVIAGGGVAPVLSWSSFNATSCTASGSWSGSKSIGNTLSWPYMWQETVGPYATIGSYSYTLTCTGAGGTTSVTRTVTAKELTPPTVTLNAYATTVYVGNSATLYWSPIDATSCTASGDWSGSKDAIWTAETLPAYTATGTHTYNLSCTGPGGTTAATPLTITVTAQPLPFVGLYVSPTSALSYSSSLTVTAGSGATAALQWYTTNATSCTASGSWSGAKSVGFNPSWSLWQETVGPYPTAGNNTYTLSCTGPGGTASSALTVTAVGTDCIATTISNCVLPTTVSGSSAGACGTGYSGTCNYACSNGTWSAVSNACTPILPDLTAGDVSLTAATAGTNVALSAPISNVNASTGAGFKNLFQKANNVAGTQSVTNIGTDTRATALTAGGTATASISHTFPVTDAGTTRYIRVCADKSMLSANATLAGTITESNEGNNCGNWMPVTVAAPSCTGTLPTNSSTYPGDTAGLSAGTPYTFSASNSGAKCQYSCNSGYSWDAATQSCVVSTCAATTISGCVLPDTVSGSSAGACDTGYSGACSYACSNTAWTKTTNTCAQLPDLTINDTDLISPTTALTGTATTFSSIVRNVGTGSTGSLFRNFLQVATAINGGGTITDVLPAVVMPTLAAGNTNTFSKSYSFASIGTYSLRVCADKRDRNDVGSITESNELNNCGPWTTVTVSNPAIAGSCSVSPDSGFVGDSFTWSTSGVSGGDGTYTYAWSGTDSLSGTTASVSKSYATSGAKSGSVVISSAGNSLTVNCTNSTGGGTVTINPCYGQGCVTTDPPSSGCSYSGPSQPKINVPAQCCSATPNVCLARPTATLLANPLIIDQGQSSNLSWTSTDATMCTIPTLVTDAITPSNISTGIISTAGTATYQITCTGPGGTSVPAFASIEVLAPNATISASPTRVSPGSNSAITWRASGVKSCTVTGPGIS
ncbi:MAG: CARDB domain-containing protein, partial [Candidatus Paceibacterota bacterium]